MGDILCSDNATDRISNYCLVLFISMIAIIKKLKILLVNQEVKNFARSVPDQAYLLLLSFKWH